MQRKIQSPDGVQSSLEASQFGLEREMENANGIHLTQAGVTAWQIERELDLYELRCAAISTTPEDEAVVEVPQSVPDQSLQSKLMHLGILSSKGTRSFAPNRTKQAQPAWRLLEGGKNQKKEPAVQDGTWHVRQEDVRLRLAAAGQDPSSTLLLEAAEIEGVLGNYRAQKEYLRQALELNINDPAANLHMATYAFEEDDEERAFIFLKRAVDAGYEGVQEIWGVADMLVEQGEIAVARTYAIRFFRIADSCKGMEDYFNYSKLFQKVGDPRSARRCLVKIMEIRPEGEDARDIFREAQKMLQSLGEGVQ